MKIAKMENMAEIGRLWKVWKLQNCRHDGILKDPEIAAIEKFKLWKIAEIMELQNIANIAELFKWNCELCAFILQKLQISHTFYVDIVDI